jgi:glycosyltransferase involved in cell wall biosynthesis
MLIVYLGKRGGGALLTRQIASELSKSIDNICVYIVDRNEEIPNYPESVRLKILRLYSNKFSNLVKILKFPSLMLNSILVASKTSTKWILFPMMSPTDYLLSRVLQLLGFKIVRVVHDFTPHPGDRWPTGKAIFRASKFANHVICLSSYVAEDFMKKGVNVEVSRFPHYQIMNQSGYQKKKNQISFIGRGNEYKNLEVLELLLDSDEFLECTFLVAGYLATLVHPRLRSARLTTNSGWLPLKELERIIAQSDTLVLPYTSATQSGLVDIAAAFSTKIVATPVGGLIEQVGNNTNGYIAKSTDPSDIAEAVRLALNSKVKETTLLHTRQKTVVDSVIQMIQSVK